MFEVWFRYVPGGTLFPYRLDYATREDAAAAEIVAAAGFWFQRPDDATVFGVARTVSAAAATGDALLIEDGSVLLQEDGISQVFV